MPIIRIGPKLVYYAHVPKCAGTAIEHYLQAQFGRLAFLDPVFNQLDPAARWNRSSPQHIDTESLGRLFPTGFFDHSFAVVRNPVDRLASVFQFQRDVEGRVAEATGFDAWLDEIASLGPQRAQAYDGHTLSMDDLVPADAVVFRIEDGLAPLVAWLQGLAGPEVTLPTKIVPRNVLEQRLEFHGKAPNPPFVTDDTVARIESLYLQDFIRFGYDLQTSDDIWKD